MCWAHKRKNIRKKVESLVPDNFKKDVMDDIDILQLPPSIKAAAVFVKKWNQKKQKTFTDYFKSEWLDNNCNWYEGIADDTPSTNNALEAFNSVIKKEETFREKLPLSRFLVIAK